MSGVAAPLPHPQFGNYSTGVVMLGKPKDLEAVAAEVVASAHAIVESLI
jgi:hypothetical protein